jgi:hypothetical protein
VTVVKQGEKKQANKQAGKQRRAAARRSRILTRMGIVAVLALIGYGISQMSNIPFTDKDIAVVDFSNMTSSQKNAALREANAARCPCSCGLTLAQCVATDSTCPIRATNIDKIKAMVTKARAAS